MAITGINTLDGKQIIAAGASSAISAQQALQTSGGNDLQSFYNAVTANSANWGDIPTKVVATTADATGSNILYVVTGS